MAFLQDRDAPLTLAKVDGNLGALRVATYPGEALGEYRYSGLSGIMAGIAANGEIFQFRWSDTAHLCVLKYVFVRYAVITGFTAAQELGFDVVRSTGWTAPGTGGSQVVPAATNLMKRNSYPTSKVGDMRIAAAAALTGGTKTLSNTSEMVRTKKTLAAAATVQDADFEGMMDLTHSFDTPIVLQQNEGFSVRNLLALGAGGTVRATVEVAWSERVTGSYP
jgi:hypothetical protein